MSDLKPCPFCGSSEIDPEGWTGITAKFVGTSGPECTGCGATSPTVEEWNTRAPSDARAAALDLSEVERLAHAYGETEHERASFSVRIAAKIALMTAIRALIGQPGDAGKGEPT